MIESYYITIPIYYVNDEPHIVHAHTTILADVLARYRLLPGKDLLFLVSTDEHRQKVRDAALKNGIDPQTQANRMEARFKDGWKNLDISNNNFI